MGSGSGMLQLLCACVSAHATSGATWPASASASAMAMATSRPAQQQQQKISLNASSVIDGWCAPQGGGYTADVPYNLCDEQALAGDPAAGAGGTPLTFWSPGFTKWYYPEVFATIDLGATHDVTSIWGWHQYGGAHLELTFALELLKPTLSLEVSTTKSATVPHPIIHWENSWTSWNVTAPRTRFLSIRQISETSIYEVVVYGTPSAQQAPAAPATGASSAAPTRRQPPLMRSFLGVNGFVDDPIERLTCVGSVREYQDWVWTEGEGDPGFPHALTKFSPSYSGFDIDRFYEAAANASLDVHQVIQNRPWFLNQGGNKTQVEWKPILNSELYNLSAIVDPLSYTGIAGHAFQVAARYGSVKVASPGLLQLAKGQQPRSGLGLLKHIEVLNEPNGWWRGREGFMKPFEIAAMLSAVYDGHEGSMSPGVGIKSADKDVQVVMPGVTGTSRRNLDIVRMIRLWAQSMRSDGRFPADVLNFHGYSTDLQADPGDATPEQAHMLEGLTELVAWRDANEPSMELWLTEFGYDIAAGSPDRAKAYAQYSAEEVQAMWLVRGFMLASIARVDRAHIYMLRNVNDRGGTKFETCGLTSAKPVWNPKLSFYAVSTTTALLGHMRIAGHTIDNSTKTYTAEFKADANAAAQSQGGASHASRAFVVWLGTNTGASKGYTLDVGGGAASAAEDVTIVQLVANSTVGLQKPATVSASGGVTLVVTEMPTIVLVGAKPVPPSGPVPPIDAPVPYDCKQSNGMPLGPGLYCDGNASNPSASYRVCPSGVEQQCPDGGVCEETADGEIACKPNPQSACNGKAPGLYCDGRPKPAKGWPDGYVVCPAGTTFFCPTETPHCTQNKTRVACSANTPEH